MSTYRLRKAAFLLLSMLVLCVFSTSSARAGRGAKARLNPSSARNDAKNLSSLQRRGGVPLSIRDGSTLAKSKEKVGKLLNKTAPSAPKSVAKKTPESDVAASSTTPKTKGAASPISASPTSKAKSVAKNLKTVLRGRSVVKKLKRVSKLLAVGSAKLVRHPALRFVISRYTRVRASITRIFSRVQSRAPPVLARAIGKIRKYSFGSLLGFMHSKLSSDKLFLGWYFAANNVFGNLAFPAMVSTGVSAPVITVLYVLSTVISVGVLVAREHTLRKRAGKNGTVKDTAVSVLHEYQQFSQRRFDDAIRNANAPIGSH